MGNLVFQAASGGQVAVSGPNTASSFTIAVPAVSGTFVTTGDTGTVTTTMLASTTGSGAVVLATSPTLVTPALGTPSSVTLTNATGLPLTTGVTGTLPVANGGTNLTSFTANGVVYASSTSALATGSALTFDGTNLSNTSGITGSKVANTGNINLYNSSSSAISTYQQLSSSYIATQITAGISGASSYLAFSTNANWTNANAAEAMRLDSSGNLLVGTTTASEKLTVNGRASFGGYIYPSVDNAYSCGLGGNRWSVIYSATALINTSDEREKTEIVDSPLGLNFVMSLKPVAYKFKTGGNNVSEDGAITPIEGKRQHFGLLAQQVKEVCGNIDFGGWVLTNKNDPNSTQGLRYDEFIAPMIKAIQELSAKVTALEAKLGV